MQGLSSFDLIRVFKLPLKPNQRFVFAGDNIGMNGPKVAKFLVG